MIDQSYAWPGLVIRYNGKKSLTFSMMTIITVDVSSPSSIICGPTMSGSDETQASWKDVKCRFSKKRIKHQNLSIFNDGLSIAPTGGITMLKMAKTKGHGSNQKLCTPIRQKFPWLLEPAFIILPLRPICGRYERQIYSHNCVSPRLSISPYQRIYSLGQELAQLE